MTIKATIVADSISPLGKRLTSVLCEYPRFIHAEVMTHRAFSRNASSSRAIPVNTMLQRILADPAVPIRWGQNGRGMQDHGEMPPEVAEKAKGLWFRAMHKVHEVTQRMMILDPTPHKQITNRMMEPWSHITVLISSTKWANFFALRRHPDAQPEIAALANAIYDARKASTPKELEFGQWHLPFVRPEDPALVAEHLGTDEDAAVLDVLLKLSVARCARTSYKDHFGKVPSIEKDINLHDALVVAQPVHASPAEHQATPDSGKLVTFEPFKFEMKWDRPKLHGNYVGWCQYRKTLPNESVDLYEGEE